MTSEHEARMVVPKMRARKAQAINIPNAESSLEEVRNYLRTKYDFPRTGGPEDLMADADFQLCRMHRLHAKTLESYRNTKASNKRTNRGGSKHQSKRAKTSSEGTENASHAPDTSAPTASAKKAAAAPAPPNPSYENPSQQGQLAADFQ